MTTEEKDCAKSHPEAAKYDSIHFGPQFSDGPTSGLESTCISVLPGGSISSNVLFELMNFEVGGKFHFLVFFRTGHSATQFARPQSRLIVDSQHYMSQLGHGNDRSLEPRRFYVHPRNW